MRFKAHVMAVAGVSVLALSVAACSSSTKSASPGGSTAAASSTSSSGGSADLTSIRSAVAGFEKVPSGIQGFTALPAAPAKGLKVAFVNCAAPACADITVGVKSAATALGWHLTVLNYDSAKPGQAVQNALDAGNKYIIMTAIQLSTITPQVQEAKSKQVPLFVIASNPADVPAGSGNGLYGVAQGAQFDDLEGTMLADYMIANSDGHAVVVDVVNPLFPALAATDQAEKAEFAKNCSGCKFTSLTVSLTQIGAGQVPSLLVSYLKAHPDTDYAALAVADYFPGIPSALKTAGLNTKVKVVGATAGVDEINSVADGTSAAWVETPFEYPQWIVAHWISQLSEGQTITPATQQIGNKASAYLVTNPAQAAATKSLLVDGGWPGPTGYDTTFKSLWKIG